MVKLSILIATVGRRNEMFLRLLDHIIPQLREGLIEVVAYWNNGELPIGEIRKRLIEEARGEYVCFIDDDDWVPGYYCDEILWALGEDYVGFEVEVYERDKQLPKSFNSIKHGVWHQDDNGFYRGVTHLNPIKREIALKADFESEGIGEDESWSRRVTQHVRTEKYIPKVMYYYRHNSDETLFGGPSKPRQDYYRPEFKHESFRYHSDSLKKGSM